MALFLCIYTGTHKAKAKTLFGKISLQFPRQRHIRLDQLIKSDYHRNKSVYMSKNCLGIVRFSEKVLHYLRFLAGYI